MRKPGIVAPGIGVIELPMLIGNTLTWQLTGSTVHVFACVHVQSSPITFIIEIMIKLRSSNQRLKSKLYISFVFMNYCNEIRIKIIHSAALVTNSVVLCHCGTGCYQGKYCYEIKCVWLLWTLAIHFQENQPNVMLSLYRPYRAVHFKWPMSQ